MNLSSLYIEKPNINKIKLKASNGKSQFISYVHGFFTVLGNVQTKKIFSEILWCLQLKFDTVEPPYNGQLGTNFQCPLFGGVHLNFFKLKFHVQLTFNLIKNFKLEGPNCKK